VLAGQKHALQIDVEDVLPDVLGEVSRARVAAADPYVVVQDVDPPVRVDTRLDERLTIGLARDVGFERRRLSAFVLDHRLRLIRGRKVTVDEQHVRALSSEQNSGCTAVADRVTGRLAGADYDRRLALKPHSGNPLIPSSS
jgi:hypothetical protein